MTSTTADDLAALGREVASASEGYGAALERLRAGIRQAVADGMSEHEAARVSGVSRMTVRKALGK